MHKHSRTEGRQLTSGLESDAAGRSGHQDGLSGHGLHGLGPPLRRHESTGVYLPYAMGLGRLPVRRVGNLVRATTLPAPWMTKGGGR